MAVTKKIAQKAIKKTSTRTDAFKALMGAALALPGISAAAEQGYRSDDIEIGVHHSEYTESGDRMTVKADQLSITGPIGRDFEGNFSATRDITSGASPVVNFLDGKGKPHQFLETGASIKDQRDIYEGTLTHYGDDSLSSIKLGTSEEDDYTSDYFSISHRIDFNRKLSSLTFGYGHSDDEVWNSYNPSVLLEEPSIFNTRQKDEFNITFGQVINKNTTIQLALTYVDSSGFLSDPYKKSFVVDEAIFDFRKLNGYGDIAGLFDDLVKSGFIQALNDSGLVALINQLFPGLITDLSENIFGIEKDNRPEKREQWISLLRMSHYFKSTNSALHTDYRYSDDSWGAYSHTLEFKWNIGLGLGWQVSPGVRFYSQHSAYFYDTFFETIPDHGYISSDYRLAGFGAIAKKLEISKEFGRDFTVYLHYEEYERQYDYEQGGQTNGDPLDDFEFTALSVSFDVRF